MSFRDPNPMTIPGTPSEPVSFAVDGKIMLTAIILILLIVILMISLHLYSRCYLLRSQRFHLHSFNRRTRAASAIIFFSDPSSTAVVTTTGLDPSVIKSLPIFTFSTTESEAIECAVCLSEFEENESGRVLPNCKHTFHVDCIDMWFHSHSSCPLCRSLVETAAEEVAISVSDLESGCSRLELSDTDRIGGAETSDNSNPEDSQGKSTAIEVPRRNLGELESDLSRSRSFRSPMSRMMSFTRILNRERRSASSSSVGFPSMASPLPCSILAPELDIELGGEETR